MCDKDCALHDSVNHEKVERPPFFFSVCGFVFVFFLGVIFVRDLFFSSFCVSSFFRHFFFMRFFSCLFVRVFLRDFVISIYRHLHCCHFHFFLI